MKQVYLDNAATTPVRLEVEVAMRPYFCEKYGNPSGVYQMSSENRGMIENVREQIAKTLNASAEEIYFTSGGTESDNWAIKAAAQMLKEKGRHIITSKIEHHAILNSCAYLEKQGFEVTYLDVDEWGSIRLDILEKAIRKDTILISVMYANNEVGTIQKIAQIGKIAEKNDILFHTDAVQAYGQLLIDVKKENIDLLINLMALKVWDSFIFVKKSLFLNTSTVANRKEIIGQAQKMFRESLEWEKQQKLHLPQGSIGRKKYSN